MPGHSLLISEDEMEVCATVVLRLEMTSGWHKDDLAKGNTMYRASKGPRTNMDTYDTVHEGRFDNPKAPKHLATSAPNSSVR